MRSEMSAAYRAHLQRRTTETYEAFTAAMVEIGKQISAEQRNAIIRHVAVLHQALSGPALHGFQLPALPDIND